MVEYKAGHDLGLDMHIDNSDVTLNVCMGREFTGAGVCVRERSLLTINK
jgi:hypothetical protein